MKRKAEPILRTPNPQQVANMPDFLEQLQSSGSAHFERELPKSALHLPTINQTTKLSVPKKFVRDQFDKVEELVTLGVQEEEQKDEEEQEDGASDSENEEETNNPSSRTSSEHQQDRHNEAFRRGDTEKKHAPFQHTGNPRLSLHCSKRLKALHQQDGHNQAFRRDVREESPAPFQHTVNPRVPPRFSKLLTASNITGPSGELNAGQLEFPNGFIRNHGDHVHGNIKLQGIHENSRNYVLTCCRRPKNQFKVYFAPTHWSRFVQDNDLKEGQELQFSLMADSYFLVRRIS